ncbi:MAG: class I SAM-dependent methyltransferase, partial [Planctomycetaceae bacterium]|nr:class I SAM-dependent methyltransferase [Planctomycetaceae bacterium]
MSKSLAPLDQLRAGVEQLQLELNETQLEQMLSYLQAMLAENQHINVTAIRELPAAITQHLLDSLTLVQAWHHHCGEQPPRRVLDLGTGGGFPAAVLACAWPTAHVLAIDGTGKKIGVVTRCAAQAGLQNLEAKQIRGNDLARTEPTALHSFDLSTARAVGPALKLLKELAPLT